MFLAAGFSKKFTGGRCLKELGIRGICAQAEVSFPVRYKGQLAGEYFADIVVEGVLVVELKCADRLLAEHTAQCLNYLKACGLGLCLLINYQRSKVQWKRIIQGFQEIDAPLGALVESKM